MTAHHSHNGPDAFAWGRSPRPPESSADAAVRRAEAGRGPPSATPVASPPVTDVAEMTVALVGIGGYGDVYLAALLGPTAADRRVALAAAVDPRADHSPRIGPVRRRGVPVFASLAAMYDAGLKPDLVVLSTPLQLHAEQARLALGRGSHVLCEKPIAATLADAGAMVAARDHSGRRLVIGYQWAFAPGVRRLKADAVAGRFGCPVRFRTRVYWPRDEAYYARNAWAGRLTAADGRAVLDSPVSNACAHFVQHLLDLAGPAPAAVDWPATVTAELYRAHPIENYDTAVVRATTPRRRRDARRRQPRHRPPPGPDLRADVRPGRRHHRRARRRPHRRPPHRRHHGRLRPPAPRRRRRQAVGHGRRHPHRRPRRLRARGGRRPHGARRGRPAVGHAPSRSRRRRSAPPAAPGRGPSPCPASTSSSTGATTPSPCRRSWACRGPSRAARPWSKNSSRHDRSRTGQAGV